MDASISIDLRYDGAAALAGCGMLQIPVHVDVSTTQSDFHEGGLVNLRFESTTSLRGSFELQGMRATIDADLAEAASGASASGTLIPIEGGAPGGWARFPAPEPAAGVGGAGP